jgi:DNA-binding CsgD family transcriptional regulator
MNTAAIEQGKERKEKIKALILEGKSRHEIAAELNCRVTTVDGYLVKLGKEMDAERLAEWKAKQATLRTTRVQHEAKAPQAVPATPLADMATVQCADCLHVKICRLKDERSRALTAISQAARSVPEGLIVEYRVKCKHAAKVAAA